MINVSTQKLLTDLELIEQIQSGDAEAETELFRRFGPRIDFLVSFKLADDQHDDWRDVASVVKLSVLNSLRAGKFDSEKGLQLKSYIRGITNNQIGKYFRKKSQDKIFVKRDEPQACGDEMTERFDQENIELREALHQLIDRLAPKYREILYLRYYEELMPMQIGRRLNLPAQKVSERLSYAVKLLREEAHRQDFFSS